MQIIKSDSTYRLFPDEIKTMKDLPVATYKIQLSKTGFYLDQVESFGNTTEKMYGNHQEKIDKILTTYAKLNRSMGVLFSGDKGIGKTLCTANLAKDARDKYSLPVIIVSYAYQGITEFIDSIKQDAIFIFDEFEKTFPDTGANSESDKESQSSFLGLLDGMSNQKHLYVFTVNSLHQVSSYLINRVGRIHYHIRFAYPSKNEVREYLKDNLEEQYYSEIDSVVTYASRIDTNYDSLRAIVTELNNGYTFKESIADLNINASTNNNYAIRVTLSNGKSISAINSGNLYDLNDLIHGYFKDTTTGKSVFISETLLGTYEMLTSPTGVTMLKGDISVSSDYEKEDSYKNYPVSSISITVYKDLTDKELLTKTL